MVTKVLEAFVMWIIFILLIWGSGLLAAKFTKLNISNNCPPTVSGAVFTCAGTVELGLK